MTTAGEAIRIGDLRVPVLTRPQLRALKYYEQNPIELKAESVLAAAQQMTGLKDFGSDDFRPRLRYWLNDAASDCNRTELGRAIVFQRCVRYASTRLRLQNLLRRHPEIHDVQISQPIVVVGPFRSGTTHLVNLLARDSRLRSLPIWESYEPIPGPGDMSKPDGVDPRFERCAEDKKQTNSMLPYFEAMRPIDPCDVDEETELQGPDFPMGWWKSIAPIRSEHDYQLDHDDISHYDYMKVMLKALQWQRGPDRWVLKSVHHAERMSSLLATFPDATIVMTHRDPVSVVQSVATMAAYIARLEFHSVDTFAIGQYWTRRIEALLRKVIRDRHLIPEGRLIDLLFHEFIVDELAAVDKVYSSAGLELTSERRRRMLAFLANNPARKGGRITYDLLADFAIEEEKLRARFSFYYQHFQVKAEVS